jgi:hypothetical protein
MIIDVLAKIAFIVDIGCEPEKPIDDDFRMTRGALKAND